MAEGLEKKKTRRATGPKPVYVLYKPEIDDNGNITDLQITRSAAVAMRYLSENPGAKVAEKAVTA